MQAIVFVGKMATWPFPFLDIVRRNDVGGPRLVELIDVVINDIVPDRFIRIASRASMLDACLWGGP